MYIASVDCRNQRSRALFWSSAMLSLLAAFHFPLSIITLIENQSHTIQIADIAVNRKLELKIA